MSYHDEMETSNREEIQLSKSKTETGQKFPSIYQHSKKSFNCRTLLNVHFNQLVSYRIEMEAWNREEIQLSKSKTETGKKFSSIS